PSFNKPNAPFVPAVKVNLASRAPANNEGDKNANTRIPNPVLLGTQRTVAPGMSANATLVLRSSNRHTPSMDDGMVSPTSRKVMITSLILFVGTSLVTFSVYSFVASMAALKVARSALLSMFPPTAPLATGRPAVASGTLTETICDPVSSSLTTATT